MRLYLIMFEVFKHCIRSGKVEGQDIDRALDELDLAEHIPERFRDTVAGAKIVSAANA